MLKYLALSLIKGISCFHAIRLRFVVSTRLVVTMHLRLLRCMVFGRELASPLNVLLNVTPGIWADLIRLLMKER